MTRTAPRAVESYLDHLRVLLSGADPADREDIVSSVREHIEDSLAQLDHPATDSDVDQVLTHLGPAEDVVASWADGMPATWPPGPPAPAPGSLLWAVACVLLAVLSVMALAVPLVGPVFQLVALAITVIAARRAVGHRGVHIAAAAVTAVSLILSLMVLLFLTAASDGPADGEVPTPTSVSSIG